MESVGILHGTVFVLRGEMGSPDQMDELPYLPVGRLGSFDHATEH